MFKLNYFLFNSYKSVNSLIRLLSDVQCTESLPDSLCLIVVFCFTDVAFKQRLPVFLHDLGLRRLRIFSAYLGGILL